MFQGRDQGGKISGLRQHRTFSGEILWNSPNTLCDDRCPAGKRLEQDIVCRGLRREMQQAVGTLITVKQFLICDA